MEAYPGGPCSPLVTNVRPVRHRLRQPIIDSVSRSTALLPGVLDGSRFTGARLWNRSVFSGYVQAQQYRDAGPDRLGKLLIVRDRSSIRGSDCRW